MKEIIMTQETFDDTILECEDFLKSAIPNGIAILNRNRLMKKLENICLPGKTLAEKWAELIASRPFRMAIGEWEKVEGNTVYVKTHIGE